MKSLTGILLASLTVVINGECTVSYRPPDQRPCPENLIDDGVRCLRVRYERGIGRIPNKKDCPPGLRDDGTSCWRDAHIYGKGCCCTLWGCCGKCKSGYTDDGCTCRKSGFIGIVLTLFDRYQCNNGEELYLHRCYPICAKGYKAYGCCICIPLEDQGVAVTAEERMYCKDGSQLVNGKCPVEECT